MDMENIIAEKIQFETSFGEFISGLAGYISSADGQWSIKGFIDLYQNIYTISHDTKVISKILEIHIFPKLLDFARRNGYKMVLAEHQNYYPDISFLVGEDGSKRFAVDFKTTYRRIDKPHLCNGFTLGSHGKYFEERTSTKNIQFPYGSYAGHYCLGIIYDRMEESHLHETEIASIDALSSIASVVGSFQIFFVEKWRIASDKSGSGNTANIGSINNIDDIIKGNGMFAKLGEKWFDDYWMNYRKITIADGKGGTRKISSLKDFVKYRKGDVALIVPKKNTKAKTV